MDNVNGNALRLVPLLLPFFGLFHYDMNDPEGHVVNRMVLDREYDFIVVGGGSAGAVVANRLSEVPHWKVLLLEAGPDENIFTDIPSLAVYLQLTDIDWKYQTEPQPTACLGFKDGRCNWPRGKVLGGSSVLNYMVYARGNRRDYDGWVADGNPGWSYREVLHYFKKSEDNRNPYLARSDYHGSGGYQTVQESPFHTPLALAFLQAGIEMGYESRDINAAIQTGFMLPQGTLRRGSRCSTAKAFLRPIRFRPNLHIALNAQVHRLLTKRRTKQVVGVEYKRNSQILEVRAKREVILSAGAINSPQIMMLSGIGPKDHLKKVGIRAMHDLPGVGQNMQDHIGLGGLVFVVNQPVSLVMPRFENLASVYQWSVHGKGPMTILGGVEALGWVNTKYANASDDYPDIEFNLIGGSAGSDGGSRIRLAHNVADDLYQAYFKPVELKDMYTIFPLLLRPKSRGYLQLRSTNPEDAPLIYANYITHPDDAKVLVEGVKMAVALSETKAMQRFGARLNDKLYPGCRNHTPWTDPYWLCMVRHYTTTIYHPASTCKMAPKSDPDAVVDAHLRVHGVKGLRVIDASIMPTIVSGNTNAPVIMIGERGSEFIKDDWGEPVDKIDDT